MYFSSQCIVVKNWKSICSSPGKLTEFSLLPPLPANQLKNPPSEYSLILFVFLYFDFLPSYGFPKYFNFIGAATIQTISK